LGKSSVNVIGLGAGEYECLSGSRTSWTTVLCGRDAVQIVPPTEQELPLEDLKQRLARFGEVLYNGFLLSFQIGDREPVLFPTGRAVSHGELARYALGIEDPDDLIADLDQALRGVPVG